MSAAVVSPDPVLNVRLAFVRQVSPDGRNNKLALLRGTIVGLPL